MAPCCGKRDTVLAADWLLLFSLLVEESCWVRFCNRRTNCSKAFNCYLLPGIKLLYASEMLNSLRWTLNNTVHDTLATENIKHRARNSTTIWSLGQSADFPRTDPKQAHIWSFIFFLFSLPHICVMSLRAAMGGLSVSLAFPTGLWAILSALFGRHIDAISQN